MSGCHDWGLDLWLSHWVLYVEGDREQISEGWTLSTRQVHFVIQKHAFFYIFTFWDLERNTIFNWTNTFLTNVIFEWLSHWVAHGEGDRDQISEGWTNTFCNSNKYNFWFGKLLFGIWRDMQFLTWTNIFLTFVICEWGLRHWMSHKEEQQRQDQWRVTAGSLSQNDRNGSAHISHCH